MAVRAEVQIVALHEMRKNLRSTKGIVMFILFLLGGTLPTVGAMVLNSMLKSAGGREMPPEMKQEMFRKGVLGLYHGNEAIADNLASCPPMLSTLFQLTIFFLPLFVILIGFDQISGEIQYRSIRYLAGRARRESLAIGKALGAWAVISVMTFVLHAVVWISMLVQQEYGAGAILSWGFRFWIFSAAFAAANVGLYNFVSAWFKTPMLALLTGVGIGVFLFFARIIIVGLVGDQTSALWIFPGKYDDLMLSPEPTRIIGGCVACIGWGAAMVAGTASLLRKRDI
jgi:ABC-type transport system involved in multi-copper enzyme maturation permease subunit